MSRIIPEFVETIERIRDAERDAAAAIDGARQVAQARIDGARKKAADQVAAARREGAAEGDRRLSEKREAVKRESEAIVARAEKEADGLRQKGTARMAGATALALRVILGEDV